MVKLTRQEIDAFLGEDVSIRHRLKLESFLSFGWIFTACFAYSFVFVVTFVVTTQIYGASFYVQQANLPPELAAAIPATEDILQIRSFIFSVLLAATSLAFVFRRGFLVTVIISVTYAVNALLQTWAFSYGPTFSK